MTANKNNNNWISQTTNVQDMADIREYLSNRADKLRICSSITYDVLLAVTEIVENTIIHGYKGQSGFVSVGMERETDTLIVKIQDQAPDFNPTTAPPPDLSVPLELRSPGGLGIYLTRQMVDHLGHKVLSLGGNEVTLVFNLNERRKKDD